VTQVLHDAGLGPLDRASMRVGQPDPVPRLRGDLGNAGAHRAGTNHTDHRLGWQAARHRY